MADTADEGHDPFSLGRMPSSAASSGLPFAAIVVSPVAFGVGLGGRAPVIEVMLTGTSTGYKEAFFVQLPKLVSADKRPLLMVFHKYGSKANDPYANTGYPLECDRRNWFMISSLGATKKSFSSMESQENREISLDWFMTLFGNKVNTNRIYGVGFSMGGGSVANYAARHLDPDEVQLAAIVDHTGGVSQRHTWENDPPVRNVLEFWFGGEPGKNPFQYQRSSVIEFDKSTLVVDSDVSMAWNLTHVPTLIAHADKDPLAYLGDQTTVFKDFLISIGGTVAYQKSSAAVHDWKTLKAKLACDFLSAFTLQKPSAARTLADKDGKYFAFDLVQDYGGAFSSFDWAFDKPTNRLRLTGTKNVKTITVDTEWAGLDTSMPLELILSSGDFFSDVVQFTGYQQAPASVLRDGVVSSAWTWEPVTQSLHLYEQDVQKHTWTVLP